MATVKVKLKAPKRVVREILDAPAVREAAEALYKARLVLAAASEKHQAAKAEEKTTGSAVTMAQFEYKKADQRFVESLSPIRYPMRGDQW